MIEIFFGIGRVVGIILLSYGALLAVIPEYPILNVVGLMSYVCGAYQLCLTESLFGDDE